ncbi:MAG: ribbon-helix-helix protein, CopG family [Planctomycetota bacterium]|nr:ribbon-helix-helix protein, CopG family [Planctomycetota bacterium]
MRTTIQVDDQLLREAKKLAAETGRTLTAVIEDSLRMALSTRDLTTRRRAVRLKTCGGKGVQPGVDLDDSASLLDLMESRGDSR